MTTEEGLVDIVAVAAHLQVANGQIYRWVDAKGLLARRAGQLLRFKHSQVEEWGASGGD